jgi:flagellar biosynthesis chaperone FliJ
MKPFRWNLQRLADVTAQREQGLRMELLDLSRRLASLRQESLRRMACVRALLEELAGLDLHRRLAQQDLVQGCAAAHHKELGRLGAMLQTASRERKDKTRQLLRVRARRKTLERLRAEALQRHLLEQGRLEQKQFDETAHVAFARRQAMAAGRFDRERLAAGRFRESEAAMEELAQAK